MKPNPEIKLHHSWNFPEGRKRLCTKCGCFRKEIKDKDVHYTDHEGTHFVNEEPPCPGQILIVEK